MPNRASHFDGKVHTARKDVKFNSVIQNDVLFNFSLVKRMPSPPTEGRVS